MEYECDECEVKFNFTKKDIKIKTELEWDRSNWHDSEKRYKIRREGGLFGSDYVYCKVITLKTEEEVVYKTVKCPVCDDIQYLTEISKKQTGRTKREHGDWDIDLNKTDGYGW